jgi:hypothetical protein
MSVYTIIDLKKMDSVMKRLDGDLIQLIAQQKKIDSFPRTFEEFKKMVRKTSQHKHPFNPHPSPFPCICTTLFPILSPSRSPLRFGSCVFVILKLLLYVFLAPSSHLKKTKEEVGSALSAKKVRPKKTDEHVSYFIFYFTSYFL